MSPEPTLKAGTNSLTKSTKNGEYGLVKKSISNSLQIFTNSVVQSAFNDADL